jgi:hypothetical protein
MARARGTIAKAQRDTSIVGRKGALKSTKKKDAPHTHASSRGHRHEPVLTRSAQMQRHVRVSHEVVRWVEAAAEWGAREAQQVIDLMKDDGTMNKKKKNCRKTEDTQKDTLKQEATKEAKQ